MKDILLIVGVITIIVIISLAVFLTWVQNLFSDWGFWTEIEINNQSNQEIWITPIGYEENLHKIGPLNRMHRDTKVEYKGQNTRFHLMPNESFIINYDMDDQNFQFILVENKTDMILIFPIDEDRWDNMSSYTECCYVPEEDLYIIPDLNQLVEAPDWLLPTIEGEFVTIS